MLYFNSFFLFKMTMPDHVCTFNSTSPYEKYLYKYIHKLCSNHIYQDGRVKFVTDYPYFHLNHFINLHCYLKRKIF